MKGFAKYLELQAISYILLNHNNNIVSFVIYVTYEWPEASPTRDGGGPPKSLAGPLGWWETMVGKRQTDTPRRESLGIEFI